MSAQIIDGKKIAQEILEDVKTEIDKNSLEVKLDIVQIGNDEATNIYIKHKVARASEVGIKTQVHKYDDSVSQEEVLNLITKLNVDSTVTGFFIQTPIPKHLDLSVLVSAIDPKKDVDGMNPYNLGRLLHGSANALVSATAIACLTALKHTNVSLPGKHAVIVGRSAIVGKPLMGLLLAKDCTVTICHSKTQNLKEICKTADILVTATGKPGLITADFVKSGAVVIDCGSPKAEVEFEGVKDIAGYITPVPGGIGPLTIASLLKNCIKTLRNNYE